MQLYSHSGDYKFTMERRKLDIEVYLIFRSFSLQAETICLSYCESFQCPLSSFVLCSYG